MLIRSRPMQVFKADRRSRVWAVERDGQRWVVKRFDHPRARQWLTALLGLHPAQRERRQARRMRRDGLRAVAVAESGWDRGRAWLATAYVGPSADRRFAELAGDRRGRTELIGKLAELVTALRERGWFFRDLKLSNVVIDGDGSPWLIDVGSARRSEAGTASTARMLELLGLTIRTAGGTWTDCVRLIRSTGLDGRRTPPNRDELHALLRAIAERSLRTSPDRQGGGSAC